MENSCEFAMNDPSNESASEINQQQSSPESVKQHRKLSILRKVEFAFSVLNQLLIGFVTFYICWMCLRIADWDEIPWHALLCTLGFLCLMSEGLIAHYMGNTWTQSCNRNEKTRTHLILQLSGALLGIAGISTKIILEEHHFYTAHGKTGLATFVLLLWSLITGLSSLYAHEMRLRMQPIINKATHVVFGLTTYVLSIISIFSAFETDIFLTYSLDGKNYGDFCLYLKIFVIFIFLLSSYGPIWCLVYSKIWKH